MKYCKVWGGEGGSLGSVEVDPGKVGMRQNGQLFYSCQILRKFSSATVFWHRQIVFLC